jgi:diamine N-acetyltransferase
MNLQHKSIYLRAVEPTDANLLFKWENHPDNWRVSGTEIPFSLHAIHLFIEQAQEFRKTGQLRLMICLNEKDIPVGCVDLYDADFKNRRAAIGILVASKEYQAKGIGTEAIELLVGYAKKVFDFHQLHCLVDDDNSASLRLFERAGFTRTGKIKDWFYSEGKWRTVIQFQRILNETHLLPIVKHEISE